MDQIPKIEGYWYLATPYSKWYGGLNDAWKLACIETGRLIAQGVPVFSPIVHTHPIALANRMDPLDHSIWLLTDRTLMDAASGLIVMKMWGWRSSKGVQEEIRVFQEAGKPIVYLVPTWEGFSSGR